MKKRCGVDHLAEDGVHIWAMHVVLAVAEHHREELRRCVQVPEAVRS